MSAVITTFDITPIADKLKAVTSQERNASVRVTFDLVKGQAQRVAVSFGDPIRRWPAMPRMARGWKMREVRK